MASLKLTSLLVAGLSFLAACGGGTTIPSGDTDVPDPLVTPTPQFGTTPTPTPYDPPSIEELTCEEHYPFQHRAVVQSAIAKVRQDYPEIFDYDTMGPDWILTTKPGRYLNTLIEYINAMPGYSATYHFYEPETHIAVKKGDDFSEVYFVMTSFHGLTDRYALTCRPAEF